MTQQRANDEASDAAAGNVQASHPLHFTIIRRNKTRLQPLHCERLRLLLSCRPTSLERVQKKQPIRHSRARKRSDMTATVHSASDEAVKIRYNFYWDFCFVRP